MRFLKRFAFLSLVDIMLIKQNVHAFYRLIGLANHATDGASSRASFTISQSIFLPVQ